MNKVLFRNSGFFWNFSSTIWYSSATTLQKLFFRNYFAIFRDSSAIFRNFIACFWTYYSELLQYCKQIAWRSTGWVGVLLTYLVTATVYIYIYANFAICRNFFVQVWCCSSTLRSFRTLVSEQPSSLAGGCFQLTLSFSLWIVMIEHNGLYSHDHAMI